MTNNFDSKTSEEVILEYPYKVNGILKVTSSRLIFKKKWPYGTFSGEIRISDLEEVVFLKSSPWLMMVPGIRFKYKLPDGTIKNLTINFLSFTSRLILQWQSGVTPEKVYETILSLMPK